jgi:hypothetical protein
MAHGSIINKPLFITWTEFSAGCQEYFLTTETQDEAINKLRALKQTMDVKQYITDFKGWAHLSGFNDVGLVDQFKTRIKKALGRKIMETGNPGDGHEPGQLTAWYTKAQELEQAYLESKKYYRKREFTFKGKLKQNTQAASSKPKQETVTIKVKDDNVMYVNKINTTRPPPKCYNCQKIGHIAKYCKGKQVSHAMGIKEYSKTLSEEDKAEMKRVLGFPSDQ